MTNKKIVILGGGIGGIVVANKLRRSLPPDINITLIERNKIHTFAASYLWLMVGMRTPEKISTSHSNLVSRGVEVVYEEVKQIDTENKTIQTVTGNIEYDYLIVSLGAELDKKYLESYQYGIHNFYTYEGAKNLRDGLIKIRSGEILIAVESMPYKCPGAPFEAAMLISNYIEKRGLKNKINISLYTPEPQPLPVAGPELGKSIADLLEYKGIKFYPSHQLSDIKPENKAITFNSGKSITYDLLIVVPKHNLPAALNNSKLTDESGWVPVDRNTLVTNVENVFAIGDVTSISIPGRWKEDKPLKLPKAGVFAHSQALTVSEIITSKIMGKESEASFCGDGFCMLEAGDDYAGFAYGDFFASPHPDIKMKKPGKKWHLGKVFFEKWWLSPNGFTKNIYKYILTIGGKIFGIPIKL
ncbi:MAG: NAD(P)/FAD-dependent oxidoreductase [Bacteroidetes bacterium]|nr:NAD(P)/FAD-dependent oxidoreductase [Bacteroidota bacterium]